MAVMKENAPQSTEQKAGEKPEDLASKPANIPGTDTFAPSGAPVQDVIDVDARHPAVDDNPRANTSILQNKIDFNDPTKSGHDVVAEALTNQGVPTKAGEEAAESVKAAAKAEKSDKK